MLLDEMQMQATQNEEIQSHLQRKQRIVDMRSRMEAELQKQGIKVVEARQQEIEYIK